MFLVLHGNANFGKIWDEIGELSIFRILVFHVVQKMNLLHGT